MRAVVGPCCIQLVQLTLPPLRLRNGGQAEGGAEAIPPATPTTDSPASALDRALEAGVAARARAIAAAVRTDGAQAAAQRQLAVAMQRS